jgi:hypothetical protein
MIVTRSLAPASWRKPSASRSAVASPIPLLAPVTATTLSLIPDEVSICGSYWAGCLLNDDAHTTIGHDDGTHDEAGFFRGEEGDDLRDFLGLRGAFDGGKLSVLY